MIVRAVVPFAACALPLQAFAQAFPSKPIRLVVGYPPGGSGDFLTRLVAEEMSKGPAKPEVREKIAVHGMDATPSASPEAFEAELKAEAPMCKRVVLDSGARVE